MILTVTREGHRDAVAWLGCHVRGDIRGKAHLVEHCAPAELLDALTAQVAALLLTGMVGDPLAFIDALADDTDKLYGPGDVPEPSGPRPLLRTTRVGHVQACALIRCTIDGNLDGKVALEASCDPTALAESLTSMLLTLVEMATGDQARAYLDRLVEQEGRLFDDGDGAA